MNPQTKIHFGNADINHDGCVDTQDALGIINIYLGTSPSLKNYKPTRKYPRK